MSTLYCTVLMLPYTVSVHMHHQSADGICRTLQTAVNDYSGALATVAVWHCQTVVLFADEAPSLVTTSFTSSVVRGGA
jgi:hypothetical protein